MKLWARMLSGNFAEMMPFRGLLQAANLRHGTDGFTSPPPKGRRAEDFFALKNPTASAGCEPANLGTKGQHDNHCLSTVYFSETELECKAT